MLSFALARHPDRAAAVGVNRRAVAARAPLLLEEKALCLKHCLFVPFLLIICFRSYEGANQLRPPRDDDAPSPSLLRFAASSASGFLFAAAEKPSEDPLGYSFRVTQLITAPQLVRDTRNLMPKLRVSLDVVARARRCKIARALLLS